MNGFPLTATFKQSNSAADFVSDDSDAKQNGYIDKGKVIHYLFSKIRYAEDASSALLNVQAQGLIAGEGILGNSSTLSGTDWRNPRPGNGLQDSGACITNAAYWCATRMAI